MNELTKEEEQKLQREYLLKIKAGIIKENNTLLLEDKVYDCYQEMNEYLLNKGLLVGNKLNSQDILNFITNKFILVNKKPLTTFKFKLVSIKNKLIN